MNTTASRTVQSPNRAMLWTGRIISGLCIIFLLIDAIMKVVRATPSVEGTASLGFSDSLVRPLGVVVLIFTILYAVPRTAVFGALLLTAHLGGATAIFINKYHGQWSFLFPLTFCVLLWAGLFLQDSKLREIVPLRK
ncbi:DoxX-like family protein [Chryseolinea serpens]|uniref:DoxX-like family protein n=2 Tax=Chryseolinea serpens TaxID=947013 RepID=A0A1M5TTX0_9BACT|nr:DoxX-like family protein [Chryseolinea serpens]